MTIETIDGITHITADAGRAIHRICSPTPSNIIVTRFPVGQDDPANWEDCDEGEPTLDDTATEADKDAALQTLGVDMTENGGAE